MAAPIGRPKPEGSGRKKGVTNGDTAKLRELILGALDQAGGQDYLYQQAFEEPKAFLQLIGKVIPKEVVAEVKSEVKSEVYLRPQLTKDEWIATFGGNKI
jgi:hypothetical protein